MADESPSTATAVWTTTLAERDNLIHNLNHNPSLTPELERKLAEIEEQLLDVAAPNLPGVAIKLRLLWEAQLHGLDDESRRKQLILSDIERLAL